MMTVDDDQIRRPRGRPRLLMPNRRSAYVAALNRRNHYVGTTGMWPSRRHEHPESLDETLQRVTDRAPVEIAA